MTEPITSAVPMRRSSRAPVKRSSWMLLSIATVLLWGTWGLQSKLVVDRMSPWMNQVLFSIGLLPLLVWMLFWTNLRQASGSPRAGAAYALLTGILGGVGNVAMYVALSRGGKASIVIPLVGLAPLITVVLAFFLLREHLNRSQVFGLVLALFSIYLLSV